MESVKKGRTIKMKKVDELKQQLQTLKTKMQDCLDKNNIEEAKEVKNQIEQLKTAIQLQEEIDKLEEEELQQKTGQTEPPKKEEIQEFCNMARGGFPANSMKEGSKEDGGYTVPDDIQTKINTWRESKDCLQPFVKVETVKAPTGQRTFKKRSQQTGFIEVSEGGKIQAKETPKFERQSYSVKKYAGYFPVTNELLEDSDTNIISTLTEWIGNESRITRNRLILEVIQMKSKTPLKGIDDIKKVINVTLDASFRDSAIIITNQDGLQYFDTLKDSEGRYLLQPLVGDKTKFCLFGKSVVVLSNKTLPSTAASGKQKIPVIIGDLKEGIVIYDRKTLHIKASDVAMNAFEEDLTLFRAIEREEVKLRDEEAFIYGELIIEQASVA